MDGCIDDGSGIFVGYGKQLYAEQGFSLLLLYCWQFEFFGLELGDPFWVFGRGQGSWHLYLRRLVVRNFEEG